MDFNCRSLYANFTKINEYLSLLPHKLIIIALPETWLNQEKGVDFQIMGYELYTGHGHKVATDPYQHTQIVFHKSRPIYRQSGGSNGEVK